MTDTALNLVSAVAIGLIIFIMSLLKAGYLKALVYSLPIPITIALVATDGHVNATNVIGLFILSIFLWAVHWLVKRGTNIYVADVIASVAYIIVGYLAVTYIHISFFASVLVYMGAWLVFVILYRHSTEGKMKVAPAVKPIIKLPVVTTLAYILLSLKSYLAGIVVTFPFSGVFAVVESRHTLKTLAAVFTRNSIAILGLFVMMFYLDAMNLGVRILIGWVAYLAILWIVTRVVKYAR